MDISFQLYSSRDVPSQTAFLSTLAEAGYTQVEGYGGVYEDPAGFRAAMDAVGLAMPSGHFGLSELEEDFEGCVATAKTLGMTQIYAPYLAQEDRPTDSAGYKAIAARLEAIAPKARAAGFGFGWHNHDFEFVPLEDGAIPMALILRHAPSISWEADLAWVIRGQADPVEWLAAFGDRITAVHVKDIAPAGEKTEEDGWADVGQGTVDWAGLVARARSVAPKALHVMEHDKPADAARFATTSIASYKTY